MKAKSVSHVHGQRFSRALASAVAVLFPGVLLAASAPPQFTYQGQLMEVVNGVNTPVTSGGSNIFAVAMWVRLYNSADAAKSAALYGRQVSTIVNNGAFAIDIGDEYGVPLPAASSNLLATISGIQVSSTLFVGITPFADANNEISPRQQLLSAPFALLANDASQALGDFTATNGTSLFKSLDVQGSALFTGAVTNQGTVMITRDVTFESGFTNTGATVAKQLAVGGTLSSTGYTAIVSGGGLTVNNNATFQSDLTISQHATFEGSASAPWMNVGGDMIGSDGYGVNDMGNISFDYAQSISSPFSCSALTVYGNAIFGTYFPSNRWSNVAGTGTDDSYQPAGWTYCDKSHGPGSFKAPADGLYVVSAMLRKDGNGAGSLKFTLNNCAISPRVFSDNSAVVDNFTVTVLMKNGETLGWDSGAMTNQNTPVTTRLYYQAFQSF